jgi:hypothetical protein
MFPCSHCSRAFNTHGELTRHMAAVKAMATRSGRPMRTRTAAPPPFTPPPTPPPPPPWSARPTPPPPPPTPPPAARPTWLGQPKPTVESQRATVLNALADLYAVLEASEGKTPERTKSFDKFLKMLNKALAPAMTPEMKNENATSLRMAAVELVKVTF